MKNSLGRRGLVTAPVALALTLTCLFNITLPIYDYWDAWVLGLACRNADLRTQLFIYWEPFVDQRMVFPKMTIALLSRLPLNLHFPLEIALGFAARLGMLYLVWLLVREGEGPDKNKFIVLLVSALLLFWPVQQVLFQHHWYSTQYAWSLLPGMLALYFLDRFWGRWSGIIGAAWACAVSGFSHGTGLPLGLAVGTALLPSRCWSAKQKAVWWLASLGAITAFLAGLPSRAELKFPPLSVAFTAPLRPIKFFFVTFTPPLHFFSQHLHLRVAMGVMAVILCIWPLRLLSAKKQLSTRENFPWLVLILWCLGIAGASALGRGTFTYPSHPIYYAAMVLAVIGAVPLWLAVYPLVRTLERKDPLRSALGWRTGALVGLAFIYITGARDGIEDARRMQANTEWAQSCLHYYPALDDHELYLFPLDQLDRFKKETLPSLLAAHALPDYVKSTPFTMEVPTTFQVKGQGDMDRVAAGPDAWQWIATGRNPHLLLKPSPPIAKSHVVSFIMETSAAADVKFYWNDGSGWLEERSLTLNRRGRLITTNSGYFPEIRATDPQRPVEAILLQPVNSASWPLRVTLREARVRARPVEK